MPKQPQDVSLIHNVPAWEQTAGTGTQASAIPIEVPWQLLGTTGAKIYDRVDSDFAADFSPALSIFSYQVPEVLTRDAYPGKRVVYFKFTVTVAPGRLEGALPKIPIRDPDSTHRDLATEVLSWSDPARALLLDIKIATRGATDDFVQKPAAYFASAAPMARDYEHQFSVSVDESNVGESMVRTGDSTTQSSESGHTTVNTKRESSAGGFGLLGGIVAGYGSGSSTTDVTINATTTESSSESTREQAAASMRRRAEGYRAQVTNLLALVRARYVGTQNLQFSVRPRPLIRTPRDRMDPDAWYISQLENLSRGLDGVQDFFAAAVVESDALDYRIKARLRVAYVATTSPSPDLIAVVAGGVKVGSTRGNHRAGQNATRGVELDEYFRNVVRSLRNYLERAFPPGASADALDIDVATAVSVIRDHVPPAATANAVTVPGKPMGPSPVTIRAWNVPVRFDSELTQLNVAEGRDHDVDVRWWDLYASVVVEWTEWVPYPVDRKENLRLDGDNGVTRRFEGTYSGRMIAVVRTREVPYKPLLAVLGDANRAFSNMAAHRQLDPVVEQLAYARSLSLSAYVPLASHGQDIAPAQKPPAAEETAGAAVINVAKPVNLLARPNPGEIVRQLTIADAELARSLSGVSMKGALQPASVVEFLVARVESLGDSLGPSAMRRFEDWAGVKIRNMGSHTAVPTSEQVQPEWSWQRDDEHGSVANVSGQTHSSGDVRQAAIIRGALEQGGPRDAAGPPTLRARRTDFASRSLPDAVGESTRSAKGSGVGSNSLTAALRRVQEGSGVSRIAKTDSTRVLPDGTKLWNDT